MREKNQITQSVTKKFNTFSSFVMVYGLAGVLLIAPVYAPLTVLAASQLDHFDLLRIWKEVALTILVVLTLIFLGTHKKFARVAFRDMLFVTVIAYGVLCLGTASIDLLSGRVAESAVIYGLLIDLRTVGMFAVSFLAYRALKSIRRVDWQKVVVIPSLLVICFGLLQLFVLPADILTKIGYGTETIVPFQLVDNRPDFVRIQSTLRGPNPLGAYLLVMICIGLVNALRSRTRRYYWWWGYVGAGLAVLYGTYSRSAWLGLFVAVSIIAFHKEIARIKHKVFWAAAALVVLATAGSLYVYRDTYFVQNVVLHTSDTSQSKESSNSQRANALRSGVQDILENPIGSGVGSAGPASLRNSEGTGRIAENYFLQIGQEVGVIGMILFVVISAQIGVRLYHRRSVPLAAALLASLAGLTVVNMLSHAWSDDTLAYTWWGLAGLMLGQESSRVKNDILRTKSKHKRHETIEATEKTT